MSAASSPSDLVVLSVDEIRQLAVHVLTAAGLNHEHADSVARVNAAGERDGCLSHGLYRLPGCVLTIREGRLRPQAEPVVTDVTAAFVRVDAGYGYSPLAFERGLPLLVAKARRTGVAAMAVNNCFHFSALWPEVEAVVAHGLVAIVMTPSHAWVAPAGGVRPALGTNPIAFGWPRPGPHPYVFDFATSAIARGDLSLHDIAGKAIPVGWALDGDGAPTTDARAALDGAMLTFGGHKGSALSTMIELMAGPLIGDMTSLESMEFDGGVRAAPCHGELVIAFDPAILGDGDAAGAERLFDAITGQGARLPSQRRYQAREHSLTHGVAVARDIHDRIQALDL